MTVWGVEGVYEAGAVTKLRCSACSHVQDAVPGAAPTHVRMDEASSKSQSLIEKRVMDIVMDRFVSASTGGGTEEHARFLESRCGRKPPIAKLRVVVRAYMEWKVMLLPALQGMTEPCFACGPDGPLLQAWLDGNRTKAFGHHNTSTGGAGKSTGGGGAPGAATWALPAPSRRGPTVPVAPKLTQPKPRTAPEPVRIPQAIKAVPVPAWIESTSLEEIERRQAEVRARTHVATKSKYHFESTVPRLHETRNTRDALREELEATRAAEMAPLPPARPPPRLPATGADVKLNAAAILREDAVIKGKQEKEAAVIRDFERNLRDTTDYFAWQEAERAKDEEARLQLQTLSRNVADNNIEFFPMGDIRNGIVHVVGPEQGFSLPGATIVCGDSHTACHGGLGALAFGIHTYSDPLATIAGDAESLGALHRLLGSYSDERLAYGGMLATRGPILRWIEDRLAG